MYIHAGAFFKRDSSFFAKQDNKLEVFTKLNSMVFNYE